MECNYCSEKCTKAGKHKNSVQKYYCKACKKYQQKLYQYNVYKKDVKDLIPKLLCNSVGIRGIARVLTIAINTVVATIKKIAASIGKPSISLTGKTIEVDEQAGLYVPKGMSTYR
jgi:insertion element IS1 protein InsB